MYYIFQNNFSIFDHSKESIDEYIIDLVRKSLYFYFVITCILIKHYSILC